MMSPHQPANQPLPDPAPVPLAKHKDLGAALTMEIYQGLGLLEYCSVHCPELASENSLIADEISKSKFYEGT